jgi:predicted alpha/beta hydrolase family esterase
MLSDYYFVIIHGAYGYPEENWFPWLAEQLSKEGAKTTVPAFPTPDGQQLDKWLEIFDKEIGKVDKNTILVGHSLGVTFILRILERLNSHIKAAFLVAGMAARRLGLEEFDSINTSFVEGDLNWEKIRAYCEVFYVYHSDNDPYIPLEFGQEIAENLQTNLRIIHNGGHINAAAGFTKFDQLLADIKDFAS